MSEEKKFVSRAGDKLDFALETFNINLDGKVCADLGASTGGFSDCMIGRGASKIYAVETAYGELNWKLRNDDRVVVMERTNALYVELPEQMDFIAIDVGWTKQELIIPKAISMLGENGDIVSLLKPHYEAEKEMLTNGLVDPKYLDQIVEKVKNDLKSMYIDIKQIIESPVVGKKGGNKEYLIWIKK